MFWSLTQDPRAQILNPHDYSSDTRLSAYWRYKIRLFIDVSALPWVEDAIAELKTEYNQQRMKYGNLKDGFPQRFPVLIEPEEKITSALIRTYQAHSSMPIAKLGRWIPTKIYQNDPKSTDVTEIKALGLDVEYSHNMGYFMINVGSIVRKFGDVQIRKYTGTQYKTNFVCEGSDSFRHSAGFLLFKQSFSVTKINTAMQKSKNAKQWVGIPHTLYETQTKT